MLTIDLTKINNFWIFTDFNLLFPEFSMKGKIRRIKKSKKKEYPSNHEVYTSTLLWTHRARGISWSLLLYTTKYNTTIYIK